MIPITVFIADDHPLVREGTRQILEQHADLQVIGEAERGDRAVELIAQVQPHVVLLDVRLPGLSGIEASARIVRSWPEIKVLLLSAYDDEDYLLAALQAGAAGYLLKTAPSTEVIAAVRAAHRGETVLSSAVARKVAQYWQRGAPSEGSIAAQCPGDRGVAPARARLLQQGDRHGAPAQRAYGRRPCR